MVVYQIPFLEILRFRCGGQHIPAGLPLPPPPPPPSKKKFAEIFQRGEDNFSSKYLVHLQKAKE